MVDHNPVLIQVLWHVFSLVVILARDLTYE
jgi:hypothetical protein